MSYSNSKTEKLELFDYEIDAQIANDLKALRQSPNKKQRISNTWRRVAEVIVSRYPDRFPAELSGHQIFGQDLCRAAARFFNEDPDSELWS